MEKQLKGKRRWSVADGEKIQTEARRRWNLKLFSFKRSEEKPESALPLLLLQVTTLISRLCTKEPRRRKTPSLSKHRRQLVATQRSSRSETRCARVLEAANRTEHTSNIYATLTPLQLFFHLSWKSVYGLVTNLHPRWLKNSPRFTFTSTSRVNSV